MSVDLSLFPGTVTITVVSTTETTDADGNTTVVETRASVRNCLLAPRTSADRDDPRSPAVITGATVYMPAGTVLDADDRLEILGQPYTIEGEPGVWSGAGLEVAVQRVG